MGTWWYWCGQAMAVVVGSEYFGWSVLKCCEEKRREGDEVKRKVEIDDSLPAKEGTKAIALSLLVATNSRDTCNATEPSSMVHLVRERHQ